MNTRKTSRLTIARTHPRTQQSNADTLKLKSLRLRMAQTASHREARMLGTSLYYNACRMLGIDPDITAADLALLPGQSIEASRPRPTPRRTSGTAKINVKAVVSKLKDRISSAGTIDQAKHHALTAVYVITMLHRRSLR